MSPRFGGFVNFSLAYCWMTGEEHEKKVKLLVAQSCAILCDTLDCSSPISSDHGILQARILAIPFSRRSYRPRNTNPCLLLCSRFFTIWATREAKSRVGKEIEYLSVPFHLQRVSTAASAGRNPWQSQGWGGGGGSTVLVTGSWIYPLWLTLKRDC